MDTRNLYSKFTLAALFCVFSIVIFSSARAFADTYNVTAVVPYDPPTIAATVTSPTNFTTTNSNSTNIQGTCQILNPASLISIWNGPTLLGSTTCLVGGTYSLTVALYEGVNVLVVKSSNINALYGPDSSPFTITYTPSVSIPEPPTLAPDNPQPTPPTEPANNPQTSGELLITSTTPFGVTDEKNSVSITLRVSGGGSPYSLTINWGDGTTMIQDIGTEGNYTFTHIYETAGIYTIMALVKDVLGNSRSFNWAVTPKTQSSNNNDEAVGTANEEKTNLKPLIYASAVVASVFLVSTTFLGGRYYQALQLNKTFRKPPKKIVRKK